MAFFCSCRINKSKESLGTNDCGSLDVIIKNNSLNVYYFNIINVEHPSCSVIYKDDLRMIKEFWFSLDVDYGDKIYDMTMNPSSFSYKLNPCCEIKFNVKLKENFTDYYKVEFDEMNVRICKTFIGQAKENHFYIFCSRESFCYNSHYSDYCKKLKDYGIKLEGKRTRDRTIEFVIY